MGIRPAQGELFAEDVLRQAMMVLIDHALDNGDKTLFLLLTRELRQLENHQIDSESLEALTK